MATSTFERATVPSERPAPTVAPDSGQYTDRQCVLIREAFQDLDAEAERMGLKAGPLGEKMATLRRALGMDD